MRAVLPVGVETAADVRNYRKKVRAAGKLLSAHGVTPIHLGKCTAKARCFSGLCPICVRRLRKLFLKFLDDQKMRKREWLFVTIFVDGWTKKPGDCTPFGPLRDHPAIKSFFGRLRRLNVPDLLVFGSIETFWKSVANVPQGKPFHLHFMISGVTKAKIKEAAKKSFTLNRKTAVPLQIVSVGSRNSDFVRSSSYVFKQTYWKKSYPSKSSSPTRPFPKSNELAELIANLGAHPYNGRLIMVGMRFDQGKFHLT